MPETTSGRARRPAAPLLAALVGACLLLAVGMPTASAHDYLVSSSPAADSVQRDPLSTVRLTFDDIVLSRPAPPVVEVVGPDGLHYESGCATAVDRVVTAPVRLGPSGRYTVTWRIVSADGHPVSTSIAFQWEPRTPSTHRGAASGPSCRAAEASSASTSSPDRTSHGGPPGWLAPVILVLLALALAGIVVASRRHRGGPGPRPGAVDTPEGGDGPDTPPGTQGGVDDYR